MCAQRHHAVGFKPGSGKPKSAYVRLELKGNQAGSRQSLTQINLSWADREL